MADSATTVEKNEDGESRRDFLLYATTAVGAAGVGLAAWPFIYSMNPAADTLALATVEVDLSAIEEGQAVKVFWRGKPVFIRHRTAEDIASAQAADGENMIDPQTDADRVQKPEWLIMVGVCTHLGCIPQGTSVGEIKGDFGGWYCPCHGSHYDTSGRIRRGPAPANLPIPEYTFVDDTTVLIG